MRIEKFVFGPVGTNCYIVINEMTSECFAVDMADCPQEFVKHIKDAGLCVKALLLTHGHFDHIMGAERFAEIFGCPVYAYEGEENILCDPVLNASATMLGQSYVFYKSRVCKSGYADRNRRLFRWRLFRLRDIQRADAVIISEKNMYCSAEIPFFIILSEERIFLREAEVSLSVR